MVFVVACTPCPSRAAQVTVTLGAVTTVFHTSRELFLLLTALVLTYNYGPAQDPSTGYGSGGGGTGWCSPPTSTWSAIYYWADGSGRGLVSGRVLA